MPKNSKRANGEGSIFLRDGKYIAQLCIGKNENGKRAFKTATASTKTEAVEKLNELKEKYGTISSVEMAKAPLYTIIGKWFEDKKNPVLYQKALKSNSIDRIESIMNTHVIPAIGDIPLNEIMSADIQSVIDSISRKGLSFSTAKKIYDYTSSLFNYAVDMEYIGKSPMKRVRLCRDKFPEAKKVEALTDDEVRALKESATVKYGNGKLVYDCGYAIPIMLETGLRVGEILALRWSRVHMDGENPYIDVIDNAVEVKDRGNGGKISLKIDTPKSKSSRRRVPLTSEAVKWFILQKDNMYFGENSFVFNVRTGEEHPVKPRSSEITQYLCELNEKVYTVYPNGHIIGKCVFKPADFIMGSDRRAAALQLFLTLGFSKAVIEIVKTPPIIVCNLSHNGDNDVLSYVMNSVSGRRGVCKIKNPNELLHNSKLENNNVFCIKEIGKKFCDFSECINELGNNLDSYLFTFSHYAFPFDTYAPQIKFNALIIQENFGFTQSDTCKYYSKIDGENYLALFKSFILKRKIKKWYDKIYQTLSSNAEFCNCQAFAAAFEFLCRQFNITTCLVTGDVGLPHIWNIVPYGEDWFHIDVGMDNVDSETAPDYVNHNFVMVSDDWIVTTAKHTIYEGEEDSQLYELPKCANDDMRFDIFCMI